MVQELQVFGTAVGSNRTGRAVQEKAEQTTLEAGVLQHYSLVFPVFFSMLKWCYAPRKTGEDDITPF